MKTKFLMTAMASAAVLAACGGGSSSGGGGGTANQDSDGPINLRTSETTTAGDACSAGVGTYTGLDILVDEATEAYKPFCQLEGIISADATLTANDVYQLNGYVSVGKGNGELDDEDNKIEDIEAVKLTINAGVHFRSSGRGSLIVTRGSEVDANGTAADPIVMSSVDYGYDGRGEWGGLVVQGFAKNNKCGDGSTDAYCNTADEAGTGFHGGNDNTDSSGEFEYLIVAEGGFEVAPDQEVNGITLHSVGYGTKIENVMVHGNQDDGIEFFGGVANVKNLILTNNGDESIDWDDGYQGNIQFALVRQALTDSSDHGIEADSEGAKNAPFAFPTIANVTFQLVNAADGDDLFRFKKGTGVNLVNIIADGYDECFKIGNDTTGQNTGAALVVTNVEVECSANDTSTLSSDLVSLEDDADTNYAADGSDLFEDVDGNPVTAASLDGEVTLTAAYGGTDLGVTVDVDENTILNGSFLMDTSYTGAVNGTTAKADAWYAWAEAVIPQAF